MQARAPSHPESSPQPPGDAGPLSLRVVAADPDPVALDFYRAALPRLGHQVQAAATGPDLVAACRLLQPDLVLTAPHLPGLDGLTAVETACRDRPLPVVLVADSY